MAVLPSLPVIDFYLAFNPNYTGITLVESTTQTLPASGASNSYWTNVSKYFRDWDTKEGRQHFLDRVEAGTLNVLFDGRDGYFFNGTTNGTGYVLQSRMPIAITATWGATTHPVFIGITDSVQEQITDQVNVDISVQASDMLKYLSLCYMTRQAFWPSYANSASTNAWFRMGQPVLAIVTHGNGTGTTITYKAQNVFNSGDNVTISGLGITSGSSLNKTNVVVATANSSQFTVTNATTGQSSGTGTAYRSVVTDELGGTSGNYLGTVAWPTYGAMIYDPNSCVDLASGSSISTGYARLPSFSSMGGLDFWVLGQQIGGTILASGMATTGGAMLIACAGNGQFAVEVSSTTYGSGVQINDGYWHHVGVVQNPAGYLRGYVDGQFFSMGSNTNWTAGLNLAIGVPPGGRLAGCAAYVDEVVISNATST